jgi:hypothetical protein
MLGSVDLEVLEEAVLTEERTTVLQAPVDEDDPLDIVIAALRSLSCTSAIEAASVCLAACTRAIPTRAALVHLYDARAREMVLVYGRGVGATSLLRTRSPLNDEALGEAIVKRVPCVTNYASTSQRLPHARHAYFGSVWSVIVAPVVEGDRLFGAIELVDPLDGSCFDVAAVAAVRYASARLAELLEGFDGRIGNVIAPPEE